MSIEDPTPEELEQIKDIIALISAGLEQVRQEADMPWSAVPLRRIHELAEEVAAMAAGWTAYESWLVGTWMAASARHQLLSGA